MDVHNYFLSIIQRVFNKASVILISITISLMVILVFINAALRYIFNSGIPASEELARYLFVWLCCFGTILAYREGKHIGVDMLLNVLKGRSKLLVEWIGQLLILATFSLVLFGGWEYFKISAASPGPATEIPFGYVSISIIITAIAILGMTISNCFRLFRKCLIAGRR